MRHAWLVVLVLLCACKSRPAEERKVAPPPTVKADLMTGSDDVGAVQPRFSGGQAVPTDEGRLGFTIAKVHAGRKPAAAAPFHEPGGDWTYLEAHVDGDAAATFVVGVPPLEGGGSRPSFGKLMFAPTTREAGARVVTHLAKALATTPPPPVAGGELQAMKVSIALLGRGIGKLDNGYGGRGTWAATKLFCSAGEIEAAELFFNYSIAAKRGEFSEKDTDYNQDVVACLAIALRDGLPPPRTPANDPTLAASGPRLELGKRIGERIQELALTPTRLLVLEERGTSAAIVEIDPNSGAKQDLYTTPDRLEYGHCDATATRCLIKSSKPSTARNAFGGDDRNGLVFLDGAAASPLDVSAFTTKPEMTTAPLSPDARFVIVMEYGPKGARLFALDRTSKQVVTLTSGKHEAPDVVAWVKEGGKWIAIVDKTRYEEDAPVTVLDWHVEAKGVAKPSKRALPDDALSPDGTRRAAISKDGKLTVTVGGKPRTLVFHPADARSVGERCCKWIDNRFIAMRTGFIDTDAMKVSLLPQDPEADVPRVAYVHGTRTALVFRADGVFLATLVGP